MTENEPQIITHHSPVTFIEGARIAKQLLGGDVRCIDNNRTLREASFALISECPGYPVNWNPTKIVEVETV